MEFDSDIEIIIRHDFRERKIRLFDAQWLNILFCLLGNNSQKQSEQEQQQQQQHKYMNMNQKKREIPIDALWSGMVDFYEWNRNEKLCCEVDFLEKWLYS